MAKTLDSLLIDLSDLAIEDIEVFAQEGSRGMADFAASCQSGGTCSGCTNSCTIKPADSVESAQIAVAAF
jgi:hypothetical protein